MKSSTVAARAIAFAAAAACLFGAAAQAADAPPVAASASPGVSAATTPVDGEPDVKRTVIEDGRTRIDELRVRGQVQRITVDPKGRAPSYEILTGDGSRDLSEGANSSRGAAGKRVWNVFRF